MAALLDLPSQACGTAHLDGAHDLGLADREAMAAAELVPVEAKDIGDFVFGTRRRGLDDRGPLGENNTHNVTFRIGLSEQHPSSARSRFFPRTGPIPPHSEHFFPAGRRVLSQLGQLS